MSRAILTFPDRNGEFPEPAIRQTVPAIFLVATEKMVKKENEYPLACWITPRLEEMYQRFKENGVNIASELPEDQAFGRSFTFYELDDNLLEIWQPENIG